MPRKQFVCPWCFGKCHEDEVVFRSTFGVDRKDMRQLSRLPEGDRERFLKYDADHPDEELDAFWNKAGGSINYKNDDPQWDMPHIWYRKPNEETLNPDFGRLIRRTNTGALQVDATGFVRDRDGFILRVVDKYGGTLNEMKRLCPHCHNPLPLSDYGKYPTIFIGVVGMTNSGKTVYLIQMLRSLQTLLAHCGYVVGGNNFQEIGERVAWGYPLPANTDLSMRRPLAVNIRKKEYGMQRQTLVFYDIAGENCVYDTKADGSVRDNAAVTKFIEKCDGLLFLIDPEQTNAFAAQITIGPDGKSGMDRAVEICSKVHNIRADWKDIPVAAVITKSDSVEERRDMLRLNDNTLFSSINYPEENRGFERESFIAVDQELRRLLSWSDLNLYTALSAFDLLGYFMVSAITCGVEGHIEKFQNQYSLSKSDTVKFTQTKEWCSGWNRRNEEERRHYRSCPVKWSDGTDIQLDPTMQIGADRSDKETELTAHEVGDWQNEIKLSLSDIISLPIVGYPADVPFSRRVEEPVLWLLWQLGVVGPYPVMNAVRADQAYQPAQLPPEPPTGLFGKSKRHAEWERQCAIIKDAWDKKQAKKIWYFRYMISG